MSNRLKILIIDDDPAVCAIIRARFETKEGHKVSVANTGDDGLALARKEKPDVILLDWMLPDTTGVAVLESLKGENRTAWVPVYMLTSRSTMADVEKALARGASGYFTKPVKLLEISNRVNRLAEAA